MLSTVQMDIKHLICFEKGLYERYTLVITIYFALQCMKDKPMIQNEITFYIIKHEPFLNLSSNGEQDIDTSNSFFMFLKLYQNNFCSIAGSIILLTEAMKGCTVYSLQQSLGRWYEHCARRLVPQRILLPSLPR